MTLKFAMPVSWRMLLALMAAGLIWLPLGMSAVARAQSDPQYWVLALSWSPSFCAKQGRDAPAEQCGAGRNFGFIVHGLWPQNAHSWPAFCASGQRYLDEHILRSVRDIMPSRGLIIHQWRKHGSCSNLTAKRYFGLTRRLYEQLSFPPALRRSRRAHVMAPAALKSIFLAANPHLIPKAVTLHCGREHNPPLLRELRICYDHALKPHPCPAAVRDRCSAARFQLPN